MRCNNCNRENSNENKYCFNCGNILTSNTNIQEEKIPIKRFIFSIIISSILIIWSILSIIKSGSIGLLGVFI